MQKIKLQKIENEAFSLTTQKKRGDCKTTLNYVMKVKKEPADRTVDLRLL